MILMKVKYTPLVVAAMGLVLSVFSYATSHDDFTNVDERPAKNSLANRIRRTLTGERFSRLPTFAQPTHYLLRLSPDLKTFKFEGMAIISINILEATDVIVLHASELEIRKAFAVTDAGKEYPGLSFSVDNKLNWLKIELPESIQPQGIKLHIEFIGDHNDHMYGFYRSSYKNPQGEMVYMVSTQFESTSARKAFPCFDEPIYKATFDVELEVDENLTALSNMPVKSEALGRPGKKHYKYERTPKMSSYLVAFAVGDFEYIEEKAKTGTVVRVYTVKGKKDQGHFALDLSCRALEWYTEFFAIPYPLPKADLLAVPDFNMGAMENWGLVTYREVRLLTDPLKTSSLSKSDIALTVAHELAHFWFGNLVTMKWWTDLWLKEGFASFMEYLFVEKNRPEFKITLHYMNNELARGFGLDALRSSHPIQIAIENPNELDEIYDSITYAKGNAVNRMLFHYLGEAKFREGLRVYLNRHQFGNAVTKDLWKALSEVSGEDVNLLMRCWTKQTGFPLIVVEEQRLPGRKRKLTISQKRFLLDGSTDETLWRVPIAISTASKPTEPVYKVLLTKFNDVVELEDVPDNDWVKLNVGTTGFYLVQYSRDMFNALLPDLQGKKMDVLDRFGLTNDIVFQFKSGLVPAAQFLELYQASANEDEYAVWSALDFGLSTMINILYRAIDDKLKPRLDLFVQRILAPVGERLGWDAKEGEGSQISLLRALILSRLSKVGHKPTIDVALAKFAEHVEKKVELQADQRAFIYATAARNLGAKGFEQLREIYEKSGFGEVERNALIAMAQVPDPELLEKVFDYAILQDHVRSQDYILLFVGATSHKSGQYYAWQFFQQNYKLLLKKYGTVNNTLFQYCLKYSGSSRTSAQFAGEFQNFCRSSFDEDQLRILNRPIRQTVEQVVVNSQLLEFAESSVSEFLENALK